MRNKPDPDEELMQASSAESNVVVNACSQLLATCLRASDERAFFAAAEGWACLIAATNMPNGSHRKRLPIK